MQFELAEQFCERALSRDPNSDRALTILGVMFVEAGEPKKATEILLKACGNFLENQNEEKNFNYTKFLYLGQLLGGAKALELYTKALEIMDFLLEKQKVLLFSNLFCIFSQIFIIFFQLELPPRGRKK